MALYSLMYYSRATSHTINSISLAMNSILSNSVLNNERLSVTGALLFCDSWFLQVLEGDRADVCELYETISRDSRHSRLQLVMTKAIEQRRFDGWRMCGQTLSLTDDAILRMLDKEKLFDPGTLTENSALWLLDQVRDIQSRSSHYIRI